MDQKSTIEEFVCSSMLTVLHVFLDLHLYEPFMEKMLTF